ncbi:MAG: CDP-alcohol phosphatidyltransferase family protein [Oscillospiraceae bacterium]|nr:CDP-alcohol phosphatidyltransferase family protein [Oscillospiraceae bacterium]
MIGYYDYTVILTYFSLLSAVTGIVVSLGGGGHPYYGCFFLLFCGFCDAFDGKVARTKQGRSKQEMNFGIQIDSLSDLVAFGVLPACIGTALIRVSPYLTRILEGAPVPWKMASERILLHAVLVLYVLAAMIRLAYYNVTEEERQETEGGVRKTYLGLPVTASALIFPFVLMLQYITRADITVAYLATALLVAVLFISPIQIRKPGMRGVLTLVCVGAVEFLLMLVWKLVFK